MSFALWLVWTVLFTLLEYEVSIIVCACKPHNMLWAVCVGLVYAGAASAVYQHRGLPLALHAQ